MVEDGEEFADAGDESDFEKFAGGAETVVEGAILLLARVAARKTMGRAFRRPAFNRYLLVMSHDLLNVQMVGWRATRGTGILLGSTHYPEAA